MNQHKPNCAALTMMLMSDPPQRAKCDCGANPQWGKHQAAYEAAMDHVVRTSEKFKTAKFWFEQGWYTVAELEAFIEHNRRMNEHLRKSMEPAGKNHEIKN